MGRLAGDGDSGGHRCRPRRHRRGGSGLRIALVLNDPITGGPLFCRIRALEGDVVEYETIYRREDGSDRIPKPSRLPLDGFLELVFDRWYEGSSPPPAAPTRPRGQPVPLDPQKIGGRPAGS